ncbi:hypothetical protein PR202_gb00169 [Eleusine coracana subsp. coracana]|uniref:Uncharacterized protein n=1 Tax=Eleusine coracana subsp. coracana TaxID=191504 RepID=A0AAV5DSP7_ELECO|nr:hypothetical protein PR202_gb00169 [Eleusine coracana subsp. coracana]
MPASPSSRRSPAQDTYHKRTNSFGSVLPTKPQDDELMLFSDMQKVERENFLLEPSEDFNESIEVKLGVNIPARGESHDMLNVDGDKNDYEWFSLVPDKFCSSVIIFQMDNTQRSTRSSASPSRLSPSPRSVARTRPSSSSSRSSPPPALQPPMPSRRSSTPPASKTLTPPRRSPSPASRRMSTGSSGPISNGARGASPVKTNRRSPSPKPHGWQSNVPGFPFDAPSNLRTSLPDRPVSRSRGGSPSSSSVVDMGSRGRRQSMSPTPSRRASSSHSIERDRMSSYSKASATSSGEDDLDSMQSIPISYSSSPAVRKSLAVMKTRTIAASKNLSKSFSPSSAPKRSFDSAVWLMDHRKTPQDRFPTTSFSKADHGATFGSNMDGKHNLGGEWEADDSSRGHEDIFMFDNLDELNEECIHEKSTMYTYNSPVPIKSLESNRQDVDLEASGTPNQSLCHAANSSQVGNDSTEQIMEEAEKQDVKTANVKPCDAFDPPVAPNFIGYSKEVSLDHQLVNNEPHTDCLHKCPSVHSMGGTAEQMVLAQEGKNHAEHIKPHVGDFSLGNSNDIWFPQTNADDGQQIEPASVEYGRSRDQMDSHNHELLPCNEPISEVSTSDTSHQPGSTTYTGPKLENTEGTGISVLLLQKSNSNKWPVQDGRAMAATNILCSEPYYARDGVNIMKRSFGRDSSSAASSSDLGSSRQSAAIFNDDSLDMTTSSFVSEVDGDAMIENYNTDRMADNDHFSTNICLSDTEMPEQLSDENNVDNIQMQSEVVQVSNEENGLDDCCMSAISEEDVLVSGTETNITKLPNDEEPTEAVEAPRKQIQRCFTLEEATDTILFCSSIVHDLAYKAATIALENEQESECVEPIRPAVTIVGKSLPKEDSLLKLPHRRTTNRKVKRKRLEGETTVSESPEKDSTAKDSSPVRSASGITRNSDNMKPPKLESKCNCIIM